MMKRMVLATLLGMLFLSNNLSAMDELQKRIVDFGVGIGQAIEKVDNVPLVDKLTNLLPFGMVAACFKECPKQTMLVLTVLLFYVLSKNESVRSVVNTYKTRAFKGFNKSQINQIEFDETLFIFDGEDADDAQEEIDTEDELLAKETDDFRSNKSDLSVNQLDAQPVIKFI